jgi:hypothetical protein
MGYMNIMLQVEKRLGLAEHQMLTYMYSWIDIGILYHRAAYTVRRVRLR